MSVSKEEVIDSFNKNDWVAVYFEELANTLLILSECGIDRFSLFFNSTSNVWFIRKMY